MLDDNIVKPLIHNYVYAIVSGFCQNLSEISIFCLVLNYTFPVIAHSSENIFRFYLKRTYAIFFCLS